MVDLSTIDRIINKLIPEGEHVIIVASQKIWEQDEH